MVRMKLTGSKEFLESKLGFIVYSGEVMVRDNKVYIMDDGVVFITIY